MRWLSDRTVDHLRQVADIPDLSGTKYRLVQELARGGMGTIYIAEDTELERQVALKVLHGAGVGPDDMQRMLQEARIIAQLEHPGIVPVHEAGTLPDGRVFYTMKLVRGRRLDQHARKALLTDLLRVFERACEAVAFAHAHGVIHRDLKPENIMVGEFGEVLVMDWGVAKSRTRIPACPSEEENGTILGTPAYMSPEQAAGEVDQIDERTDVFALGAILYFLLTRRPPFEGPLRVEPVSPRRVAPAVPRRLEAICLKAMAARHDERYASVQVLRADISRFLDGQAVEAYREGLFEHGARWVSRNRTAVILVLAYLLMRSALLFFTGR